MNNNSKKLKGFTLIELIVVMAIFSIIMVAALALMDPVSRVMNTTSIQEKNAAYVDNMEDYLQSSMKYSEFIRVYEGDFSASSGSAVSSVSEQTAVENFVKTYFDGKIDSTFSPVTGKIRVLKIYNSPVDDGSGTMVYGNGEIVESIWNFTAGDTYVKQTPNPLDPANPIETTEVKSLPIVSHSSTEMVINPDYYKDYSFFFKLGYNEYNPLQSSALLAYGLTADPDAEFYYSELSAGKDYSGNFVPFGQNNFSVSVVTYEKGNKNICPVDNDGDGVTDENKIVFKSPSYMSSSNMALMNVIPSGIIDDKYYQIKQDNDGRNLNISGAVATVGDTLQLEQTDVKGLPFEHYPESVTGITGDNIYFIYVLPSEIQG